MSQRPVVFRSFDRAKFFELDPYGHMNTQFYVSHFLEHRMTCLREYLGWDLAYISKSPLAFITKDIKLEFYRPVVGDKEFEIKSFVTEFQEKTCSVELTMEDRGTGKLVSKCFLTLACFEKSSNKTIPWPDEIKRQFLTEAEA